MQMHSPWTDSFSQKQPGSKQSPHAHQQILPYGVREHLVDDVPDAGIAMLLHPDAHQQRPAT